MYEFIFMPAKCLFLKLFYVIIELCHTFLPLLIEGIEFIKMCCFNLLSLDYLNKTSWTWRSFIYSFVRRSSYSFSSLTLFFAVSASIYLPVFSQVFWWLYKISLDYEKNYIYSSRFSVGSGSWDVLLLLAVGGRSGFIVDPMVFFIILCTVR